MLTSNSFVDFVFRACSWAIRVSIGRVAARLKWLFRDADAVAEASDAIGERIKQGIAAFSDGIAVASPNTMGLSWPVVGDITSPFGLRYRRLHPGVDIRGSYGIEVRAAAAGRVLISEWFGPYGNVVVLDHDAGLATVYAHQAGLIVSEGESVDAGQVLGFFGNTGRSSGPHLHFEVRVHSAPVDPLV